MNLGIIRISCGTKDRVNKAEIWSSHSPFLPSEKTKCLISLSGPQIFGENISSADVRIEIRYGDTIPDGGWWGQTKEIYRTGTVEVSAKLILEVLIKLLEEQRHQLSNDELTRLLAAMSLAVNEPKFRTHGE